MSLAIAYGMKKKKMAKGGKVKGVHKPVEGLNEPGTSKAGFENDRAKFRSEMAKGYNNPAYNDLAQEHRDVAKKEHHKVLSEMKSMRGQDRRNLAEGGMVDKCMHGSTACDVCHAEGGEMSEKQMDLVKGMKKAFGKPMAEGGDVKKQENMFQMGSPALNKGASSLGSGIASYLKPKKEEDDSYAGADASELGNSIMAAEGGVIEKDDLVSRAMKSRANKTEVLADFEPNEFDDMVLDDNLEDFHYTGKNSGDELGNDREDEDRKDIVARAMRSRAKGGKMPRPA